MPDLPLHRIIDWTDRERRGYHPRRELARLLRRARARWLLTLGCALALTGLVVYKVARRVRTYEAEMSLRVNEGSLTDEPATRPPGELQKYVWDASLSRSNLLPIVERHGLYPEARTRDQAAYWLKDGITLAVYQNYFREYRHETEGAPRSARIYLAYRHVDPDVAYQVVLDLGQTIIDYEARSRQQINEFAVAAARRAVDDARLAMQRHQAELAAVLVALETRRGDEAALRVQLGGLRGTLTADEVRLRSVEVRARSLELLRAVEQNQLGLHFTVVDTYQPERVARSPWRIAVIALIALLVVLPLCAIGVGAFDSRIYDGDDAARLGVNVVGCVPRFDGDEVGSLAARGAGRLHIG